MGGNGTRDSSFESVKEGGGAYSARGQFLPSPFLTYLKRVDNYRNGKQMAQIFEFQTKIGEPELEPWENPNLNALRDHDIHIEDGIGRRRLLLVAKYSCQKAQGPNTAINYHRLYSFIN